MHDAFSPTQNICYVRIRHNCLGEISQFFIKGTCNQETADGSAKILSNGGCMSRGHLCSNPWLRLFALQQAMCAFDHVST